MDFIAQVADLKIITINRPRTFLTWNNTEEGRDKDDCYERIDNGYIIWVNQHNTSRTITKNDAFFYKLEKMYQHAIDNTPVQEIKKLTFKERSDIIEKGWGKGTPVNEWYPKIRLTLEDYKQEDVDDSRMECIKESEEQVKKMNMKVGNTVTFYLDLEKYTGIINRINGETADIVTCVGMITNIPIYEIETT